MVEYIYMTILGCLGLSLAIGDYLTTKVGKTKPKLREKNTLVIKKGEKYVFIQLILFIPFILYDTVFSILPIATTGYLCLQGLNLLRNIKLIRKSREVIIK